MASVASLLLQHFAPLYGYVYAALGSHADTEDTLQEISVVVVEKFALLDHEDHFLPWVREIARRKVLEHINRVARGPVLLKEELLDAVTAAAEELDRETDWSARHEALVGCLESLPPESRRMIRMRYDGTVAGVDELALRINRTTAAAYGLLKRIREALRLCIERKLAGST